MATSFVLVCFLAPHLTPLTRNESLVAGFFLFVVGASVRAHLRPVQTGQEGLVRQRGHALEALEPLGRAMVEGEIWRARVVEGQVAKGEEIEVVGQEGFTLLVRLRRTESRE